MYFIKVYSSFCDKFPFKIKITYHARYLKMYVPIQNEKLGFNWDVLKVYLYNIYYVPVGTERIAAIGGILESMCFNTILWFLL